MEMNEGNNEPNEPTYTDEPETGLNINFGKKTENNLMNRFLNKALEKGLQDPRPSKLDQLYSSITDKIAENSIQNLLTNLGGGAGTPSKGKLEDFVFGLLNTQAAAGFGAALGGRIPETIESLTKSLGKNKAEEIANVIMAKMGGQNSQSLTPEEQQENNILQIDENNPEQMNAYAQFKGISLETAKMLLPNHKRDIANKQKNRQLQSPAQPEMVSALSILTQEMTMMKQAMAQLQSENNQLRSKTPEPEPEPFVRVDSKWGEEDDIPRTQPPVNMFNQKIAVDIDEISKANLKDSFFENKPIEQEIPQLVEEKNEKGGSNFRMSGDPEPKVEITTQAVQPITPKEETPKEEVEEEIKDEPEIDEEEVKEEPITRPEPVKNEINEVDLKEEESVVEEKPEIKVDEDKKVVKRRISKKIMTD